MTDTDDLLRRLRDSANEIALAGHNGWGNACAAAADEIERLRAEVADLREPRLLRMDATGARLEMELTGGMCRLFAESFATDFQASGATNYLEAQFTSNDVMPGERFVVTVQRVEGKTPHQLRADADARATRAESELAALRGRIEGAPLVLLSSSDNADGYTDWRMEDRLGNVVSRIDGFREKQRVRLVVDEG